MTRLQDDQNISSRPFDMSGRRGLILGVANHRSIAWAIAQTARQCGASVGIGVLDERAASKALPLVEGDDLSFIAQCNVQDDHQIDRLVGMAEREWGRIDFLVHSLAFAQLEDLRAPISAASRRGFLEAFEVSAHSLLRLSNRCGPLFSSDAAIVTLSYLGAEIAIPSYGLMGPVKAALEAEVRYLAAELGASGIRVNAVSAGPLKTLAASALPGFRQQLKSVGETTPLKRGVTHSEVANAALFLCSPLSSGITGEVLHVDAGQHAVREL